MKCPRCQSPLLKIDVSFTGNVACKFSEGQKFQLLEKVALRSEFAEDAGCRCLKCHWQGRVADARANSPRTQHKVHQASQDPLTAEELRKIEDSAESLSPRSRAIVQRLIDEVERLNSLLDAVTRVSTRRRGSDDDTVIG